MLFKQLGQGEFLPLIFLLLLGVDALRKQPFIVCGDLSGRVQVYIGEAAYRYSPFTSLPEITQQEFLEPSPLPTRHLKPGIWVSLYSASVDLAWGGFGGSASMAF